MSKNYYEMLGVSRGAGADDIKKAYRELCKKHHPDKGGNEEKFKEINEAYSTLSDPRSRQQYDNPSPFGSDQGFNPFAEMFRHRGPRPPDPNAPRRGRNIMLEHEVSPKYFIFGGELKVNFSFRDPCPDCAGTGAEEKMTCSVCNGMGQILEGRQGQGVFVQSSRACGNCHGRGFTAKKQCEACSGSGARTIDKDLTLDVPRGIGEGQVIGAAGEGGIGLNGGPPGDLGVRLHVKWPNPDELTEEQQKALEEL